MSETYLRQWEMLRMIPKRPRKISAPNLRDRLLEKGFEANLRTIQRDPITLSRTLPLVSDGAKPAGWSWGEKKVFDIPGMDAQTALTFALVERFLTPMMPRQSLAYLQAHFVRAHEVLGDAGNPRLKDWMEKVRVLPRGLKLLPAQIDADVLDAVYAALLGEKRLAVSYMRRGERRAKQYEINPLGLVVREAVTYIVGTLWDYPEPMHFAIHRMKNAEVLDKPCGVPEGFNLDEHIETGEFSYPISERNIKLEVLFEKDAAIHLYETRLSEDQQLSPCRDGRVRVKATVKDTQELRWWLLGFGERIEVIKPVRLSGEFRDCFVKLAQRYH